MFRFRYQKRHASGLPYTFVSVKSAHRFLRLKRICSVKQGGFTALEMMVVLAIVGIMSSLAIPRLKAISAQRDVDVVASEIAQQMEAAKLYAQSNSVVVRGCPVAVASLNGINPLVCLNLGDNANWNAWIWTAPVNGANAIIMRSEVVPAGVNMISNENTISFNRNGIANGSNLTITVTSGQAQTPQKITLAQSGRITLSGGAMLPVASALTNSPTTVLSTLIMDAPSMASTPVQTTADVLTSESMSVGSLSSLPIDSSVSVAGSQPTQ